MLKQQQKDEPEKKILINFKVTQDQYDEIAKKAKKYTKTKAFPEGNMSEWLRYSGMNCEPKKSDLVK